MKYEKDYHLTVHNYLETDGYYYVMRSNLAFKNYWAHINPKGKKILDFGCGCGHNTVNLSLDNTLVLYDTSEHAVEFCKTKGLDATSDFARVKQQKYDYIFCAHVLEHVNNPLKYLEVLKSLLSPQGQLILVLPSENQDRKKKDILKADTRNMHLYCWNRQTICNLLHEAGYTVLENKVLVYGLGYKTFMKFGLTCTNLLTKLLGRLFRSYEMKIVASN